MITIADVVRIQPLLAEPCTLLQILHYLELPAKVYDPKLAVSFGNATALWTYAEMRHRGVLPAERIQRIMYLWGQDIAETVDKTDADKHGQMPMTAIGITDRRFVHTHGLLDRSPVGYDLLKCTWVDFCPSPLEGLTYSISKIAEQGYKAYANLDTNIRPPGTVP